MKSDGINGALGRDCIIPIFIFSLPRAGSTLLQRLLATHELIATQSEPWVALPFIYALRKSGVAAEYSHATGGMAVEEFIGCLSNGVSTYNNIISEALLHLYANAVPEEKKEAAYFLDKTPRYSLICEELIELFPDGKFVFLWRNPVSVVSSIIETFGDGRWNTHIYDVDLYKGLSNMVRTYKKYSGRSISLKYEDLVREPRKSLAMIFDYIGVSCDAHDIDGFIEVKMKGSMGDPTGVKKYKNISTETLNKWRRTICNPWRKWWCKKYIMSLDDEMMDLMGYDKKEILSDLDSLRVGVESLFSDLFYFAAGKFYKFFSLDILRKNVRRFKRGDRIYKYG